MQKVIEKKELNNFIKGLMKSYEVIAPVKRESTRFEILKNPEDMYLDEITLVPPKKLFLPENEELLILKKGKFIDTKNKIKQRIIFGLRKCDLNSFKVLDNVMKDSNYLLKRKETILIGMYCEKPDKYCFCNSMELEDYYDLFFYPEGKKYFISIGSDKGKEIVKKLKDADKEIKKDIKNFKELKNKDIGKEYQNEIWQTDVDKCLSCSACTVFCPTCNCFDIKDFSDLEMENGSRKRSSASCQLKSFSKVAGGKIFREERSARFKHFVYHKIVYYKKRFNRYMCVGCGRCLRACPTKIDWTNTINLLKEVKGDKHV